MATIPSLALIPSGYKALKVYSVLPTDGVGDFDFARGTIATRVNSDGLIETVSSNIPRLNYPLIDGVVQGCPSLLLEPERTNLVLQSNQFDTTWSSTNLTLTSNQVGVGGSIDAWKLSSTGASSRLEQTLSTSGQKSYTIYAKKGSLNFIRVFARDTGDLNPSVYFNLSNGTIGTEFEVDNATIKNIGNGWYRCEVVFTKTITNVRLYPAIADGDLSQTSGDIYIQYAQLEAGSYATSYIPTTTTTVTRSAETCNNAGDATTFNDSEGVLMFEVSTLVSAGSNRIISLTDGTSANKLEINFDTVTDRITVVFTANSSNQYVTAPTLNEVNFNKIAIKYKTNDFALWVNGIELNSQLSGNTSLSNSFNKLNFSNQSGGFNFYGNTKQIQYFNTALNDTDLETLTSWDSFSDMAIGQLYEIE